MYVLFFSDQHVYIFRKKIMNKKTDSERKNCVVSFRVNQSEKEQIEYMVKLFRSTKSNWFRKHCQEIINVINIPL